MTSYQGFYVCAYAGVQAYAAAKRARRQRGRYAEAYMRRWRQLVVCWGWRRQAARERHLRACAAEMQKGAADAGPCRAHAR